MIIRITVNRLPEFFLSLFFFCVALSGKAQESPYDAEPPAAEEVFVMEHLVSGPSEVVIRWQIPKFYYLYKDKFVFSSKDFSVEEIRLPPAEIKQDPFFGPTEVYRNVVEVTLRLSPRINRKLLPQGKAEGVLDVVYQGCWEGGICYPALKIPLKLSGFGASP